MAEELSKLGSHPLTGLFPGLRLIGAIRLAFDPRKMVIATLGLILFQTGSSALDRLFPGSAGISPDVFPGAISGTARPLGTDAITPFLQKLLGRNQHAVVGLLGNYSIMPMFDSISEPIRDLTSPLSALIEPGGGWGRMLHALLCVLWAIVIWGICGGAISRIAIVQIARIQQTSIVEALRFSIRSAASLILAPVCPLLAIGVCSTVVAPFGLLYRLPVVGFPLAGILLFIPLAVGLVMTLLAAGLVAGWPLMLAAVASGAENALDAWSRTFSYLNQRIGAFVAGAALVTLEGFVGLILVNLLAGEAVRVTVWGLGLTAGAAQTDALSGRSSTEALSILAGTHPFWLGAVAILAKSWTYSFFWTAWTMLYLWVRHDVDGTPWNELEPTAAKAAT